MPQLFRFITCIFCFLLYPSPLAPVIKLCPWETVSDSDVFSHLSDKTDMAVRLFDALKVEPQSLRFIIQEATNSLATAYKVSYFFSTWLEISQMGSLSHVVVYSRSYGFS